jgi:hypothetical protein
MRYISIFRKSEAGIVLVYVILAFALALLVIPSILSFGFGAHRTAELREQRMLKVYAADAGIEDALYRLKFGNGTDAGNYTIPDVNGYHVNYTIKKISGGGVGRGDYEITSTASSITPDFGGNVTIVSHTGTVSYKGFFDNVLTSQGSIKIGSDSTVHGDVALNGKLNNDGNLTCEGGEGDQCVSKNVPEWPTREELGWPPRVIGVPGQDYYWTQAVADNTYSQSTLSVPQGGNITLGPSHTTGSLTITGVGEKDTPYGNLTLTGNLYVEGNLNIGSGAGGNGYLNLWLNGKTIYAEGSIQIMQSVNLHGPGCIVGVEDVGLYPTFYGDGFVFVMSLQKKLTAKPNGNFTGSLAGITDIIIGPHDSITWIQYPVDELGDPLLDFPGGTSYGLRIEDYIILD